MSILITFSDLNSPEARRYNNITGLAGNLCWHADRMTEVGAEDRLELATRALPMIEELLTLRREDIPIEEVVEPAEKAKAALLVLATKPSLGPPRTGHCRICDKYLGSITVKGMTSLGRWCAACTEDLQQPVREMSDVLNGRTKAFEAKLQRLCEEDVARRKRE